MTLNLKPDFRSNQKDSGHLEVTKKNYKLGVGFILKTSVKVNKPEWILNN